MNQWIELVLKPTRVRFVCGAIITITLALLVVSFVTTHNGVTVFGPGLGADYAAFYVAGKILNEYSAGQLYDLELQNQLRHRLMPDLPAEAWLPFRGYPPLVAVCFRPLALLPYESSYFVWLILSAGFYVAGFALIWRTLRSMPTSERATVLLLALSFEPFLMETWVGGQLSTVSFFWIALALFCDDRRRSILAGAALAFLFYKPTLLLLILPLLLVGGRLKTLLGLGVCGSALSSVCALAVGWQPCWRYVQTLTTHFRDVVQPVSVFADWKFVDLVSFVRLLARGYFIPGWIAVALLGVAAFVSLAMLWRKHNDADHQRLLWPATLTCTLIVNVYVGIYDTTLVVISALLTTDIVLRRGPLTTGFREWLLALYIVPWFSPILARLTGVQLYTLVLAGFAIYQLRLFHAAVEYFSTANRSAPNRSSAVGS